MHIGLIAPPWTPVPPVLYGGTELVVDRLARGLVAAGHDVTLFASGDSSCPVPRRSALAVAQGWRIGQAVPELLHVTAAYQALADCDLVHDHTVAGPLYGERLVDLPIVTTAHGPLDGELGSLYQHYDPRIPIVAISHAQRRSSPAVHVDRVIHHGIDVNDFPFGEGRGGYCLFLGRMTEEKGPHRAMEAASKAGVPLLIAAKMREADECAYFEKFVQPYLNDRIVYLGEVDHDRKMALLADATALLFPIRWNEPFGLVMIEALACGTPVLAFPEGAAPEVIEDGKTGFLCQDEAEMAEAIAAVPALDRLACRLAVEEYFCTRRMVAEYVQLYRDVIDRGPEPPRDGNVLASGSPAMT